MVASCARCDYRACAMPVGQTILLGAAVCLLLIRLLSALRRQPPDEQRPSYPEPALKLDDIEQPHELFGEIASTLQADHDADVRYLRPEKSGHWLSKHFPVARKITLTGGLLGLLVAIPYLVPGLEQLRLLSARAMPDAAAKPNAAGTPLPTASVGEAQVPGVTHDQQNRAQELDAAPRDQRGPIAQDRSDDLHDKVPDPVKEKKARRPIDDPSGKALDKFFAKLMRVENQDPGSVARVLYYGDSIVASDFVTGKLRRMLQSRFGDAGHGYALIANAWPGWFHIDVSRKAAADWKVSTCVGPYAKDHFYGLGCASFVARRAGIWSRFATADRGDWGRKVSRFEIEYLKQAGGGTLELLVDGKAHSTLETDSERTEAAWHSLRVPDAPHSLEIRTADERPTRLFGIRMERDVPGIIVSAAGITGARARFLDKQDDAHFAQLLATAKPDLVALAFGSNEITDGMLYPLEDYRKTLSELMRQIEQALPNSAYLLVGPPDMASKNAAHGHSRAMAAVIVKQQKELAAERGWAFWDQYRAMGGAGSMWAWIKGGLGSADMFHPTGRGANLLGTWQYLALMQAYEKYKAARR